MTTVHLLIALPCEAKPIVNQFRLKRLMNEQAFTIYARDKLTLTVSGIGKNSMAAAVAYTHLLFGKQPNSVWLNIGVAGHRDHPIGRPFLAEKIVDADSKQSHYPVFTIHHPCPTLPLITFSSPQSNYPENSLCDMEASAFFEVASRFSTAELIQSLKIVSDNRENNHEKVSPKQVSLLIEKAHALIEKIINNFSELASTLPKIDKQIPKEIFNRWHFTVSEQKQLSDLLQRWKLLAPKQPIEEINFPDTDNRKELLRWFTEKVDSLDLNLPYKKR